MRRAAVAQQWRRGPELPFHASLPGARSADATIDAEMSIQALGPGASLLRGLASPLEAALLNEVAQIAAVSPFRHMTTPGGYRMSVAMTNCGDVGWISDRDGYRYDGIDPITHKAWPPLPALFLALAATGAANAGYEAYRPDVCLINRYQPGARLSLHRDQDEADAAAPIVSVSLGVAAKFLWGGLRRQDRTRCLVIEPGDVVVWGGKSRYTYHGVSAIASNPHPLTGHDRINLTFRRARHLPASR